MWVIHGVEYEEMFVNINFKDICFFTTRWCSVIFCTSNKFNENDFSLIFLIELLLAFISRAVGHLVLFHGYVCFMRVCDLSKEKFLIVYLLIASRLGRPLGWDVGRPPLCYGVSGIYWISFAVCIILCIFASARFNR